MAATSTVCLDARFPTLRPEQRFAVRDLYKHDRKRGWSPNDARYYVNMVIDHQVDHETGNCACPPDDCQVYDS